MVFKKLKNLFSGGDVLGIDLGTTNTVASILEGGKPIVIESEEGGRLTPSIVSYGKDGVLVGDPALRQAITNPKNTIYSSKRFIGRTFQEVLDNGAALAFPYKVHHGVDQKKAVFIISGRVVNPEEVAAEILSKVKKSAESYLGRSISRAVITVPAYFNDSQRQATIDAAKIAGLKVERIINEPTAAALAYSLEYEIAEGGRILVYDLGGGTFDVSILETGEGENDVDLKVVGTSGDPYLGGDNFDELIIQKIVQKFSVEKSLDITQFPDAMQRLKEFVVKAKIELSKKSETEITIPYFITQEGGKVHNLHHPISRADFEGLIRPLIQGSIDLLQKALDEAKLKKSDIDTVFLVGGSTRIPLVQKLVEEFFSGKSKIISNRGTDEIVAMGAAVYGGIVKQDLDIELEDVTSLSLGIEAVVKKESGIMSVIIPKNTPVPCEKVGEFSTVKDNQTGVDILIYQGEEKKASQNHLLGTMAIEDIAPAPAGKPQIFVTYSIDRNGVLTVSAKDDKGREQKINLKNAGALEKRELQRIQKEQALPAEERRLLLTAREELSREIERVEEKIEDLPEGKEKEKLAVVVEEAERRLQEVIETKDLTQATRELQRVED